jgi:CysZ protein
MIGSGGPLQGARYVLRGLGVLSTPGLRRYVILPILLNLLLLSGVILLGVQGFSAVMDWAIAGTVGELPGAFRAVLWVIFALLVGWMLLNVFVATSTLLGSPFYALLSQRLETMLRGEPAPQASWKEIWEEVCHTLVQELHKFAYFLLLAIPFLLLFLIPGVNFAAPFLFLLYSCWVMGLECIDFPLANHLIPFAVQRRILRQRMVRTMSFGSTALLLSLIPGINLVALPAAVAGATILWVEELEQELSVAGVVSRRRASRRP